MSKKLNLKLKRRKLNKLLIDKVKSSGCIVCNEKELCCLEYHHINPETKIDTVVNMINESTEVVLEEINKCVVLCANCHRKVHAGLIKLTKYL